MVQKYTFHFFILLNFFFRYPVLFVQIYKCVQQYFMFFSIFSLYIVRKSRVYKLQCFSFGSLTLVRMGQNMKYFSSDRSPRVKRVEIVVSLFHSKPIDTGVWYFTHAVRSGYVWYRG